MFSKVFKTYYLQDFQFMDYLIIWLSQQFLNNSKTIFIHGNQRISRGHLCIFHDNRIACNPSVCFSCKANKVHENIT